VVEAKEIELPIPRVVVVRGSTMRPKNEFGSIAGYAGAGRGNGNWRTWNVRL
jgi:hypothetical protein